MPSHALSASSPRPLVRNLYPLPLSIGSTFCLFYLAALSIEPAPSPVIYLYLCGNIPRNASPPVWFNRLEKQSRWS